MRDSQVVKLQTARLLFQEFLQRCGHHFPILFGMVARLDSRIVVLNQRDAGPISIARQLNGHSVVVFRFIRQSREWAEVGVSKWSSRLELKDHTLDGYGSLGDQILVYM